VEGLEKTVVTTKHFILDCLGCLGLWLLSKPFWKFVCEGVRLKRSMESQSLLVLIQKVL
jgi:hypothetical protein